MWVLLLFQTLWRCSTATSYTNPVIVPDSPDPGVLQVNDTFYAYTTSGDSPNIFPIHASTDLVNWQIVGYVFTSSNQPEWAVSDFWAPEVHIVGSKYNVYFAGRTKQGQLCVGVAVADSPVGPFMAQSAPLVQSVNVSLGSIDPHLFNQNDSEGPLLLWKLDGNAVGIPTVIYAQPLTTDGTQLSPDTKPTALIANDLEWESVCIEAPWLVYYSPANSWYLFYSGNMYNSVGANGTCLYSVGVARSTEGPLGPFEKLSLPILTTSPSPKPNTGLTGPGHCSVLPFLPFNGPRVKDTTSNYYIVYHAWTTAQIGGSFSRHMAVDLLTWQTQGNGTWPTVGNGNPSVTPQPYPS